MISVSRTTDDSKIAPSLERCRAILDSHYGPRFAGLVLYGSRARGTVTLTGRRSRAVCCSAQPCVRHWSPNSLE